MKIKFLGAAGTVTGSSYLLTSDAGESILIDLGSFQGASHIEELNFRPFEADCSSLLGVVLTHAHLDHCGRLPILVQKGFTGLVYLTAPTADLTELSLLDSAKIHLEDHENISLFNKVHVSELVERFHIVNYHQEFSIGPFHIVFRDAGHIIGSAIVEITVDGKHIVFSGDLGNSPEDLTLPTEKISSADVVIMESTYGDRNHPDGNPSDILREEIDAISKTSGTLLIPAFSLERTQELLHLLYHIHPTLPVYMDSPMGQKATEIYQKYKSLMNSEIQSDFKGHNPFLFPALRITHNRRDSMDALYAPGPKVIIAGSGMMTGGRILMHAQYFLPEKSTRLLIVGYQGEGTLGRLLLEGEKNVVISGKRVHVEAEIHETQTMSSHADQQTLFRWLKEIKGVKKVILTHGENEPRSVLAQKITSELHIENIAKPLLNEELRV